MSKRGKSLEAEYRLVPAAAGGGGWAEGNRVTATGFFMGVMKTVCN